MVTSDRENSHLAVVSRPRQVRVAYLIDPDTASFDLLDAIFSTCSYVWGGRLSPIIPVIGGVISPAYWRLLEKVDPDWVYSYTLVSQETMDRLIRDIAPLHLKKHSDHLLQGDKPYYRPSIADELIRVHELLPLATEQRWFRTPSLVTYAGKRPADRLIERNFGVLQNYVLSEPIARDIQQLQFDDSIDLPGFLELAADYRDGLVFPYGATCARAVCESGSDNHWAGYSLFIGDKVSDWITFWNHIFTIGATGRGDWRALCLPANALSDQRVIDSLIKFLRRFAYRNGQHPPYINWISSSASEDELRSLASPFISRKVDAIPRFSIVEEWSFPELAKREKPWFGFSGGGFGEPEALGTSVHQIPQSGGLVDIPSLPFRLGNDVRWVRDVHIEYRAEQLYYGNEELSYQLPRKNLIARSFCALPARVDSDGGLAIEMRPKAPLVLQIPEDRDLLLNAIGCGRRIGYTGDFKWTELQPVYQDHGLSDKAKYCRGVLNLFEGLQSAHRMFENRFWRRNFYRLANVNSEAAAAENSPLYNKIAKHPDQWTVNPNTNRDDELRRIESLITKYARHIRTSETDVTFRFLSDDFKRERDEAVAQNPHLAPVDEQEAEPQAENDLKRTLQELVNARILQQGIITHCRQCGSRIWRELGSIRQDFECPGCGATTHTPVEGTWHYRLNSLVSKAISEHGTVPLINALAKAREEARNSFIYSPGFQFYMRYEDKKPITEVDAICLVDGKLWIGEVKSNAREFSDRDMNKLISDAKALGADKAFVYAQEGNQNTLNGQCKSFSAQSGIEIVHLYPGGFGTMPAYYA